MKNAKVVWVMSPTSYRAAPPRIACNGDKLTSSANIVNNMPLRFVHAATNGQATWIQIWIQIPKNNQIYFSTLGLNQNVTPAHTPPRRIAGADSPTFTVTP